MKRYVWRSPAARAAIAHFSPAELAEYEIIEEHLREWSYPIRGSGYVRATVWFGRNVFRYDDDRFPFMIVYDVDEHEIDVLLVLRTAPGRSL